MFAALTYLIFPLLAASIGLGWGKAMPIRPSARAIAGALGIALALLFEAWTLSSLATSPSLGCRLVAFFLPAFYGCAASCGVAVSALKGTCAALALPTLAAAIVVVGVFAFAGILNGDAASIAQCD